MKIIYHCDFILEPSNKTLKQFLGSNGLYNLIKGHTCFKGKGSLIDLKPVSHEIMKWSKLENKANKIKYLSDIKNYKKQLNYVVAIK